MTELGRAEGAEPEVGGPPASARELKTARAAAKEAERSLDKQRRRLTQEKRERVAQAVEGVERLLLHGAPPRHELEAARKHLDRVTDDVFGGSGVSTVREILESVGTAVLIAAFLRAFVLEAFRIPSGSMIPTLQVGDQIFVNKFVYGLRVPFTNSWLASWSSPERGEVIVFRYPRDQSKDYIKRVVAVAGDRVRAVGRELWVNGSPLGHQSPRPFSYLDETEDQPGPAQSVDAVAYLEQPLERDQPHYTVLYRSEDVDRVPFPHGFVQPPGLDCGGDALERGCQVMPGYVFTMGDNRDNSSDGRVWGGVPLELVKGKALFVWWSIGEHDGVRWSRIGHWIHRDEHAEASLP